MTNASWNAGDIALCVEEFEGLPIKKGKKYTVIKAFIQKSWRNPDGVLLGPAYGLIFLEVKHPLNRDGIFHERFFTKENPPEADEFDKETIDLYLGKTVKEPENA